MTRRGNKSSADWCGRFCALIPSIVKYLARAFYRLGSEAKEEAIQGALAGTFVAYARLVARGRESLAYPSVLARFAVAQVRSGRQVGGRLNIRDISSSYAQRQKNFVVERLDRFDTHEGCWRMALVEDRQAPVPDRVALLIDYPAWLHSLPRRERQIATLLARGHRTTDVAHRFRLSLARISQMRREFHASWLRFHGEAEEQERMDLLAAA
jgi:hypothetical protein